MLYSRFFVVAAAAAAAACTDATVEPALLPDAPSRTQYDAQEYHIRDLGTFGGQPTQAMDIDKHGTVFGRYGPDLNQRSYKWTADRGFEDLGDIDGAPFQILAVNDHGLLSGVVFSGSVRRAAAWVPGSGFMLVDPGFSGGTLGSNDRGVVAGTRNEVGGGARAFLWSNKEGLLLVPVAVDNASSIRSGAADVNNLGTVAGQVSFVRDGVGESRAFVWNQATGTTLIPRLGPADVGVTHVSDEGLVLGASWMRRPVPGDVRRTPVAAKPGTIPVHAWKWSATGGLVDLGTLGGDHSVAWNADREGNVYGWASDAAGVQHAVKWPAAGGIIDLGPNTVTGGVNKHGVVVGWSTPATGASHALIFTPTKR